MKSHGPQQARLPMASGTSQALVSCRINSSSSVGNARMILKKKKQNVFLKNEIKAGMFHILLINLVDFSFLVYESL